MKPAFAPISKGKGIVLLLMSAFLLFHSITIAQPGSYDPAKVNKKAVEMYEKAIAAAGEGNYKLSLPYLYSSLKHDKRYLEAYLSIAGIYGELKQYDSAIINYEIAKDIDSAFFQDYNLPYSINLAGKGQFQKAYSAVQSFLSLPYLNEKSRMAGEYRQKCYAFAIDYEAGNPNKEYKFEPQNLGDGINSEFSEYYPSITIDGSKLIFTRKVKGFNEDFFETHHENNGWGMPSTLQGEINTNLNEGALTISQDGQWLIFTGCNFPDGYGSCDLYISYLTKDGWSAPENLGDRLNSEFWDAGPTLSPDKRELYFASARPGGYGGIDLYVSHRLPNGKFGEPENLGPEINTAGNESTPFMHADNQTLYFTSNGHIGYGGDDLFLSKKGSKNTWSKPRNLGFPIN
ncbi:MAG TPA: flagellar motor protein MotB, partial [Chitinophagaceae bacterium]